MALAGRVRILTVNVGSTSVKIVEVEDGRATRRFEDLDDAGLADAPDAVAHRVVHGGTRTAAVCIDDAVLSELRALTELAPLHQPPALDAVDQCRRRWPATPQVACFDTTFHTTMPRAARVYALPEPWRDTVRSYGFHGLSHAWTTGVVERLAPEVRRLVVAHLGGGSSLCGVLDGESIVTTMGFTPLDGLVMATRCGALDPGAVAFLARRVGDGLDALLEQHSGLLGLCGTDDFAEVLRRADDGGVDAIEALAVWRHRLVTELGRCIGALGGMDAIAFTGGIGECSRYPRDAVAQAFGWLGVAMDDPGPPDGGDREVSGAGARVRTFVVASREDLQLALEARAALAGA